jgi:hypothetical protein
MRARGVALGGGAHHFVLEFDPQQGEMHFEFERQFQPSVLLGM